MMKHKIYAAAALGAVALSLAACGGNTSASAPASGGSGGGNTGSTASADTSQMPTVKLMVGGIDKQIYLPYQLAESLGYYNKYGVKVELSTEQHGGVGAEEAMASGQVDMAGAWYIHTVDFQSKGKDVIDLVQLSGAPGERIMCSPKANVHSGADLRGKTVGVTDLGSGTDELTQFIAAKAGVTKNDYHTIAVGAGATAIAAIQRFGFDVMGLDRIDALVWEHNERSIKVLERLGYRRDALLPDSHRDATGELRNEWRYVLEATSSSRTRPPT